MIYRCVQTNSQFFLIRKITKISGNVCCFSYQRLLLFFVRFLVTFRFAVRTFHAITLKADPFENQIMAGKFKSMSILDVLLQIIDKIHFYIEDFVALYAPRMIMSVAFVVKTVGSARYFYFVDLAYVRKEFQVSIYRSSADIWVFRHYQIIHIISGCR